MTAHSELVARLEGASEGSRELDAEIDVVFPSPGTPPNYEWPRELVPAYSTSLDAALALASRVLPGWDFIVGRTNGGLTIHAQVGPGEMQFGNTPALALCIAVLRAKEPQPDGEKT